MRNRIWMVFALSMLLVISLALLPVVSTAETAEQVEMRMKMNDELERLEAEHDLPYYLWTIDQKYGYEQQFIDYLTNVEKQTWFAALPGDGDLTEAQATQLALDAVVSAFGDEAIDDGHEVSAIYMTDSETGATQWDFAFYMGPRDARTAVYHVSIDEETDAVFAISEGELGQG